MPVQQQRQASLKVTKCQNGKSFRAHESTHSARFLTGIFSSTWSKIRPKEKYVIPMAPAQYLLSTAVWQLLISSLIPSGFHLHHCSEIASHAKCSPPVGKFLLRVPCRWKDSVSDIWFASLMLTSMKHHLFQFLIFLNPLFSFLYGNSSPFCFPTKGFFAFC